MARGHVGDTTEILKGIENLLHLQMMTKFPPILPASRPCPRPLNGRLKYLHSRMVAEPTKMILGMLETSFEKHLANLCK